MGEIHRGVGETPSDHRRPGATLYRALLRELLPPTLYTLLVLTAMLLTQDLLGYSRLVINHGLGLGIVGGIALYQAVPVIAATLPFSMLVGSLAGLGRMRADRELLAIETCAVSPPRLVGPVMVFSALVSAVALLVSLEAAPWANRSLDEALEQIAQESPAASVSAGQVQNFGGSQLLAREVSSTGENLSGVMLWVPALGETAFARSGRIAATKTGVQLELENGTVVLDPRGEARVLHFEAATTTLHRDRPDIERRGVEQLRGLSLRELNQQARDPGTDPEIALKAEMELHRRFALPVAPLALGLLCVPLCLARVQASRAGGIGLGMAATLAYYGLVQLGEGMIQNNSIGVALGIWLPNVVAGAVGLAMMARLTRQSAFVRGSESALSHNPLNLLRSDSKRPLRTHRWSLQRYIARQFLNILRMTFAAVLVGYFLVDLLERLEWLARLDPPLKEFLQFYAARLPLLASRIVPMALLVATAMTVSSLASNGEITAMRACGIPAIRGLLPVLVICAFLTPLYFLYNDLLLPRTNAYYTYIKAKVVSRGGREESRAPRWYLSGNAVYEALEIDSRSGTASNLKIYTLDEDRLPVSRIDARSARSIGDGNWRLKDPVRVELEQGELRRVEAPIFAQLGDGLSARVHTRHMSTRELQEEIVDVENSGLNAVPFRLAYWMMWATPLSCLILPALALFFSISGPPYPTPATAGILCVVVAVSFTLLTGITQSLGHGGLVPPWVAGWTPAVFFSGITAFFGWGLPGSRGSK